jgi:hypothetical protein
MRILLAMCLAACGTDAGPCAPNGTGSVTGSVMSVSFQPIATAFEIHTPDGVAIALVEDGETCAGASATSQDLVLVFCAEPVATRYDVLADAAFRCPIAGTDVIFEHNGGTDFARSTGGGDVTISHADDHCVTGTYHAMFGTEMLSGDFDAVVCP